MSNVLAKAQKQVIKNAPTILSVIGAIGTLSAVVMSSDAAIKAKEAIENAGPNASKADKALIYANAYAPTAGITLASMICIFGSNRINQRRLAGIAGAYILSETTLKEYKDKAEEIVGKKKARQIKDEIIQDRITNNPPNECNTIQPTIDNSGSAVNLWYDNLSGRYFYSNADKIRRAELEANRMLDKNGFVSINDVYELLGIPEIKMGYDTGWQTGQNREVVLSIGGGLTDIDTPCGVLDMDPRPNSAWFSEL